MKINAIGSASVGAVMFGVHGFNALSGPALNYFIGLPLAVLAGALFGYLLSLAVSALQSWWR